MGSASKPGQHEISGGAPLYLPAKGISRLLSIPVSSFYKYVKEGRLPEGRKIGRNKIWRVDAVLAAIEGLGHSSDEVNHGKVQAASARALQPKQARKGAVLLPLSQREAGCRSSDTTTGQSPFAGVLGKT